MANSYIEYTSGLTGTTFSVPFNYISINDVQALGYDGITYVPLTVASRSHSAKTITLDAAPSAYTKVRVYRSTATTQLVDFQNGSRLSEADLDTAYQQGLFAAQEIAEDASTTQFSAVTAAAIQSGTSLSNFSSKEIASDGTDGLIDGVNDVYDISSLSPQTSVSEAYRVSIDGVMQSPVSAYSITITPAEITFSEAPPVGAKIVIVSAASAASAVSVDNVTIGLTSANKAGIKDLGVSNAKLAGSITQDKLAGSIATSKLAEVIDDDTFTTGVSATSLASSESIKAYVDGTGSLTTNGYSVLPSGLIIQWGQVDTTQAAGEITIDFPLDFNNACLNITATLQSPFGSFDGGASVSANLVNTSQFKLGFDENSLGSGDKSAFWQAIGH